VIDGTAAGTWEWNIESGIVYINDRWAAMIGYKTEELGTVTYAVWKRLLHPDDLAPTEAILSASLVRNDGAYEVDFRLRHKLGHWVWNSSRGNVTERTADGQPRWMAGTHQDIGAHKENDDALKERATLPWAVRDVAGRLASAITRPFLEATARADHTDGLQRGNFSRSACTPDARACLLERAHLDSMVSSYRLAARDRVRRTARAIRCS
jgi:PAS domain S-box-containing protein